MIERDFAADRWETVQTVIGQYGAETWHPEPDRVRGAILRLADGDMDRLVRQMETALQDYRDVIALAE